MSEASEAHLQVLAQQYQADVTAIATAAEAARALLEGDARALRDLAGPERARPPLIPDVPLDEPPPYVPPPLAPSANALIPDTPLVDSRPAPNPSSIAFDDAPLWQN